MSKINLSKIGLFQIAFLWGRGTLEKKTSPCELVGDLQRLRKVRILGFDYY